MSLENFIKRFSKLTETYYFYNRAVELRYEVDEHRYLLVTPEGLEPLWGVTSIVHVVDKSEALVPWSAKMTANKVLATIPPVVLEDGARQMPHLTYDEFETRVLAAKSAHKEKLEEAGNIGHIAHAWIEAQIKRALAEGHGVVSQLFVRDPLPGNEKAANCCTAALDWMQKHSVCWVCTERKVYSRKHKYAGTTDGLCYVSSCDDPSCCSDPFTNRLTLADWKTSNYLYMEYVLQTAGYEGAIEEEDGIDIKDRWVLRLGKDDAEFDPWHLTEESFDRHFRAFIRCLELSRDVEEIREEMRAHTRMVADARRAVKKAEREAALKVKCPKAERYKGSRLTTCNDGDGQCEACAAIYQAAHSRMEIIQETLDDLDKLSK